jgi:DNA helicase HerA-like ATPase
LAECVQESRKVSLDLLFATQRPNQLNKTITNEVMEAVCFALAGPTAVTTTVGLDVPQK